VPELGLQPGAVIRQDGATLEIYNPGSGPPRQFRIPPGAVSRIDQLEPAPAETTTTAGADLSEVS